MCSLSCCSPQLLSAECWGTTHPAQLLKSAKPGLCSVHFMSPLLLQGYTLFGMLQQAGQFELLPPTVQPTQGLQFTLLMFAIISVIYIGLSIRINIATT